MKVYRLGVNQYYAKEKHVNVYPEQLDKAEFLEFATNYNYIKEENKGITSQHNPEFKYLNSQTIRHFIEINHSDVKLGEDAYGNIKYSVKNNLFEEKYQVEQFNENGCQDCLKSELKEESDSILEKMILAAIPSITPDIVSGRFTKFN